MGQHQSSLLKLNSLPTLFCHFIVLDFNLGGKVPNPLNPPLVHRSISLIVYCPRCVHQGSFDFIIKAVSRGYGV